MAAGYLRANLEACSEYARMCSDIDCDYEVKDNYVYSINDRKKLKAEVDALHKIGYPASLCENIGLPLKNAGAVKFQGQAQFHPLKFLAAVVNFVHLQKSITLTQRK